MSKPTTETLLSQPIPTREQVTELGSENGQPTTAPEPAPARPAPTLPVDHLHLHRRLERLLVCLEQQGICVGDDLDNVRTTP